MRGEIDNNITHAVQTHAQIYCSIHTHAHARTVSNFSRGTSTVARGDSYHFEGIEMRTFGTLMAVGERLTKQVGNHSNTLFTHLKYTSEGCTSRRGSTRSALVTLGLIYNMYN